MLLTFHNQNQILSNFEMIRYFISFEAASIKITGGVKDTPLTFNGNEVNS